MGVIKQGILGGFSGSVAGVVGSSWKGIATIKAKPLSVANPKTVAQVANRTSFKATAEFGSKILSSIVKPLWDRFAIRESGYNSFVRDNKDAFDSTGEIDLEKVVISKGKLSPLADVEVVGAATGQPNIEFDWSDSISGALGALTDKVYVLCYNKTQGNYAVSSAEAVREDTNVIVEMPTNIVDGDNIGYYLAPISADGTVRGPQATNVIIASDD